MKLERIPEYVTSAVVILLGLGFAILAGRMTGEGQMRITGLVIGGSICAAICIGLRARTWLLIPLCWELTGYLPFIEIPFAVRDLTVMLVFGSYLVFIALKIIRQRTKFDGIDLIVMANLAYLGSVYVRNPVGLRVFESEMIGGRPYFNIGIAALAYWVLKRAPINVGDLRRLPIILLLGSGIVSLVGAVTYVAPSAAGIFGRFYSGFSAEAELAGSDDPAVDRKYALSVVGNAGIRTLCSYFPPITLLLPFYPFRFAAAMFSIGAILLSGFRSALFGVIIYFALATYFRRRLQDLFVFIVAGCVGLSFLAVANGRLFNLPLAAQRAMSFLPGNWDSVAVSDAKGSSDWRYEMWRLILTEDRWIKNKWLGDGFGFTQYDLTLMEASRAAGDGSELFAGGVRQEAFLIVGSYHNGPLSTIRYVGITGLILFYFFMVAIAIKGWKLIRRSFDGSCFAPALFIGIPVIISPFIFTFMVGGFDHNLPEALLAAGLLSLLERAINSAESNSVQKPERIPELAEQRLLTVKPHLIYR